MIDNAKELGIISSPPADQPHDDISSKGLRRCYGQAKIHLLEDENVRKGVIIIHCSWVEVRRQRFLPMEVSSV